ncbi:Uncharacterized protein GBIM_08694 [Gryllus bimaculatus]|nr:Uncharacterized protein GBIM_08694 [Gryllus bimaculatus]
MRRDASASGAAGIEDEGGAGGEQARYDTAYACEGKTLKIECKEGELIHLIRANYGRFSITICNDHGNTDWSVNCMSHKSLRVLHNSGPSVMSDSGGSGLGNGAASRKSRNSQFVWWVIPEMFRVRFNVQVQCVGEQRSIRRPVPGHAEIRRSALYVCARLVSLRLGRRHEARLQLSFPGGGGGAAAAAAARSQRAIGHLLSAAP